MNDIFPGFVSSSPQAGLPFEDATAYLFQGADNQILFMQFTQDTELPAHSHAAQWGIVLEGKIELVIDGVRNTYAKGDRYYIPEGATHSGKIMAGYADITHFNQKDRYSPK